MKISIIGSGVVGSIVGKGFKQLGHEVIFFDINKQRNDEFEIQARCSKRATVLLKTEDFKNGGFFNKYIVTNKNKFKITMEFKINDLKFNDLKSGRGKKPQTIAINRMLI